MFMNYENSQYVGVDLVVGYFRYHSSIPVDRMRKL
jgi:hypothetical protein